MGADAKAKRDPSDAQRRRRDGLVVQAEVHDRHQLELRFNHPLDEGGRWSWDVDAYFFVPRNVGLNPGNYGREQFYSDFTAFMRIDAQPLPLDALADERNPASPLSRFVAALERVRRDPRPPPMRPVEVQVRLYANLFATGVREEMRRLQKFLDRRLASAPRPRASSPPGSALSSLSGASVGPRAVHAAAFEADLAAVLARVREAIWAYRRVRARWWPFERLCPQSLADAMRAADEYMSLAIEERLATLSRALGEDAARYDGTGFVARCRAALAALAAEEARLRARYGYLTLSEGALRGADASELRENAASGAGEYFTYRASMLKKSVQQALYLQVRGSRGDTFLRNAVSAVGAALAAIWALAAQVPTQIAGLPTRTQFVLFAGAVAAYVLKDRIKANTSEFLLRRARTYDHVSWLHGGTLPDLGITDLRVKMSEGVRFIPADAVPAPIRAVRSERHTVQHLGTQTEEVIHYRKRIASASAGAGRVVPEGYRLRDLLRINVRHFLVRLDDPRDRVEYFDREAGAFREAMLPKVYHVNLVIRLRRTLGGEVRERVSHLRLVLDKEGIVRCDEVRPHGDARR